MEKNIAYPTDARLYERARDQLVALAQEAGVELRQSYARLAPRRLCCTNRLTVGLSLSLDSLIRRFQ